MTHDNFALKIAALLMFSGYLLLAPWAWGAIIVTDRGDHEVLQEMVDGNGAPDTSRIRDVGITYTTTGSYDSVKYAVLSWKMDTVIMAGKFRDATGAGTYTDTIQNVPAQYVASRTDTSWYRIAVYGWTGGAATESRGVNKWGVGQNFSFWGQSNMVFMTGGWPSTDTACDMVGLYLYRYSKWIKMVRNPFDTANSNLLASTPVVGFVNKFIDSAHRLVGVTGYALGATSSSQWARRNPLNPADTFYQSVVTQYGFLYRNSLPIKPRGFISWQGESDYGTTQADFKTNYNKIYDSLKKDLGYSPKHFTIQISNWLHSIYDPIKMVKIAEAQSQLVNDSNVFMGSATWDLPSEADGHTTGKGKDTAGMRAAIVALKEINGTISDGYRGPRLTDAHFISRNTIRLSFGLHSGRKLVCPNISLFNARNKYFDTIPVSNLTIPVDSQSVLITIRSAYGLNDSIKWGYDAYKLDTSGIFDNAGYPMERMYNFAAITTEADSLADASDRYWLGTTDSNWSDVNNWSATSGGSAGASVPTSSNYVYFDANGNNKCVLTTNSTCKGIYATAGYTADFKDKWYSMNVDSSFYWLGPKYTAHGQWTMKEGDFFYGPITGTFAGKARIDLKGNCNFGHDTLLISIIATLVECAYPGKCIYYYKKSNRPDNGFIRNLRIRGGEFRSKKYVPAIWADTLGDSAFIINSGSTTEMSQLYYWLVHGQSSYRFPKFSSTSVGGAIYLQLRSSMANTFTMIDTIHLVRPSVAKSEFYIAYYAFSGAKYSFIYPPAILIDTGTFNIGLNSSATQKHVLSGCNLDINERFNITGSSTSDSLLWNNSTVQTTRGLKFAVKPYFTSYTTNLFTLNGAASDSINVLGTHLGNVAINKTSNGTKQVGVARYGTLTLTDGTFTQQNATDTVQAVNAIVNTTDAVTNVAPWNISNKLQIASGLTLTLPSLIIGGTALAPDTLRSGTPGSTATLAFAGTYKDTIDSAIVIIDMTLAAGDTVYVPKGVDGGGNSGGWIFSTGLPKKWFFFWGGGK